VDQRLQFLREQPTSREHTTPPQSQPLLSTPTTSRPSDLNRIQLHFRHTTLSAQNTHLYNRPRQYAYLGGAIRYALTRYLDDGTIEIDNNAAERAHCVSSRSTARIISSPVPTAAGERAAAIYSLLGPAKRNSEMSTTSRIAFQRADCSIPQIAQARFL